MNKVNEVYKNNKSSKVYAASAASAPKDTLAISGFAKEMQVAKQSLASVPDVRQNRVDEVKQQIEAGTYNVSASQVADKLLKKYFE